MTDKQSKPHITKNSFIFCIIAGIFLIIAAIFLGRINQKSKADFIKVTATVSEVTDSAVYVDYTINDRQYTHVEIVMAKKPVVTNEIPIYVSKEDFTQASSNQASEGIFRAILITGIVFLISGVAAIIVRRILVGPEDTVVAGGKFIYAKVDQVIYETSITNEKGEHPFIIKCHEEDFSGKFKRNFVSPPIYSNPNAYIAANKNNVKIFIKGKKRYRFELALEENQK